MRKSRIVGAITGFIILCIIFVMATFKFASQYINAQAASKDANTVSCEKHGNSHNVIIQNDSSNPNHTYGKQCDTLTFTNSDNKVLEIAFGPHENHQPYDGITERILSQGQSFTIILNQTGTFHFHDHIGDIVQGDFTVNK